MSQKIKNALTLTIVFSLLTLTGSIGLLLRIISFGTLLNFNRKYFMPFSSRLILRAIGMKLKLPFHSELPKGKFLITFNHNSYLDIFALTALGYTNTIFLLSEKTIKIIPVTLSALSIGIKYIPQQHHHNRRVLFFKKMESFINQHSINIAASSEGVHNHHHGIDRFNRGIYHLATVCKLNILPLFISIPKESNPFNKYKYFKKGCIEIEYLNIIDTSLWTLDKLDENKEYVRSIFVEKFNSTHNINNHEG